MISTAIRALLLALLGLVAALLVASAAAAAPGAHAFAGGLAAIEAEDLDAKVPRGGKDWVAGQSPAGSVGGALQAAPDTGIRITGSIPTSSPELAYRVVFPASGTHQLWLRVYGIANGNTLHAGLDGAATAQNVAVTRGAWRWVKAAIAVPSAGEHTVQVWMREDGIHLDRIVLTADAGYTPTGTGPAATPREDAGPDTTPPTLAGRQPAAGATGVAVGANVVATFSEPMDPATLTGATFTLAPTAAGPTVAASVAASAGNTTYTLNPAADLAPGTEYAATVGTGATDAAGNALASPQAWTFTTTAAPPAGGSGAVTFAGALAVVEAEDHDAKVARAGDDWVAGASPSGAVGEALRALPDNGTAATGDVVSITPELAYRVAFPAAGTYFLWLRGNGPDGAGNSAHTGINGALAPSYHFVNTYGSWAWLGKAFNGARATVVVPTAGVHTVHVWSREDGFGLDRLLLTADAGYTPTGTGPAATPREDTGPDTTPPTLTGRQPAPGATGVAAGASVVATFSEAMDPATLTGAFTLAPSAGGPAVAAAITAASGDTVFTLNPAADLTAGTPYTATMTTGAKDSAGNALASPQSWSFTTAAAPPSDTTAPTLAARQPAPDATGVAAGADVVATFSEAMDPATLSGAFTLAPSAGGSAVAAAIMAASGDTVITLDPATDLAAGTRYTATVTTGAKDAAGNPLASSQSWSFTTAAAPEPGGDGPVTFASGLGVVEAEDHDAKVARSGHDWVAGQSPAGSVGAALQAAPDTGSRIVSSILTAGPELAYRVLVPSAGTHALWLRVHGIKDGNSLHAGLDGTAGAQNLSGPVGSWSWVKALVDVPSAGEHTMHVWMREDGLHLDRLLLAADTGFTPSGSGPAATPRGTPPPDTTAPGLVARQPASGATGVPVGANVVAGFSEAMDPDTLTAATFTLAPSAGGAPPPASLSAPSGGTTWILDPSVELTAATTYTATVTAGARDLAGNALHADQTWSFTTAAAPPPGGALVARDIAAQAGLQDTTGTQGENCIFDFDGDGIRDIFLSTHGTGWRLMRGRPDHTFVEVERFPGTDRHGCAIGDFGGVTASGAYTGPDGRPDIYATVGACQGTCTTPFPNELWLQRPDGTYLPPGQNQLLGPVPSGNKRNAGSDAAYAFGVADERGRGREPLGFDIDGGGLLDLFVGNEESELYFSANRLFRTRDDGGFSALASSAVVQEVGSLASASGDLDGDGLTDLANVGTSRLAVFRNTGGGFEDATTALGIPTGGGAKDIEFADLNGDGRLDLVIANHTSLKVRLNRDGRFPSEDYSRSISQGRDLAVGDADGDGHLDVYVVLGQNDDYDDLLLRNGGRALSSGQWELTPITIPQVGAGEGDSVQALHDWAGTSRAAFLVNNGKWSGRGARQLIFLVPA